MVKTIAIPDPENIQFGELNPGYVRSPRPEINKSELRRRQESEYMQPDVTKEISGPRLAIAVEAGRMEFAKDVLVGNASGKYENTQQLMVVKARIVEAHRINPQKGLKYADGITDIKPEDMHVLLDDFVAEDESITETPQAGDYIYVDFDNRLTMTGPKYLGLKYRGSKNSGAKPDKTSSQPGANNTSLGDTTAPPSNGSPIPADPSGNLTPQTSGADNCQELKALNRRPGLQPVTSGGPKRPTDQYEQVEMIIIDGTSVMLFPKKYIRAVNALMAAFKQDNGYELGINSAYRRVDLQRCMFENYKTQKQNLIQQGRTAEAERLAPVSDPDIVGRPPLSPVHIAGRAIDFNTGYDPTAPKNRPVNRNREFTEYYIKNKQFRRNEQDQFKRQTLTRVMAGEFGPTAKWLVQNSERFGFRWSGWGFQELWHYDFDVELGRTLGLVDE